MLDINNATREQINKAWPEVAYKGQALFPLLYGDNEKITAKCTDALPEEFQECYVGYDPDKDIFIMGFDTWPDEVDDDEDCCEGDNIFMFRLNEITGEATEVDAMSSVNRMFYSGNLKQLHNKFPNLLDIRLD